MCAYVEKYIVFTCIQIELYNLLSLLITSYKSSENILLSIQDVLVLEPKPALSKRELSRLLWQKKSPFIATIFTRNKREIKRFLSFPLPTFPSIVNHMRRLYAANWFYIFSALECDL